MDVRREQNQETGNDQEEDRREEGEQNRQEMDEIPPHGTDPLHEGP